MIVKIISAERQALVVLSEQKLISDILKENGFALPMPCAGNHTCGKCMITVSGSVSDISDEERNLLADKAKNFRLSCMTYATGDCEIILPENKALAIKDGVLPDFQLQPLGNNYGFAVDIGTTTVAVYLYNLKSGELLGQRAFLNPQASSGADVISRIESALKGNGEKLSVIIKSSLSEIFKKMCNKYGIEHNLVDFVVLTGNTTMMYLLLEENVTPLSKAPFEISNYLGEFYSTKSLSFNDFCNAAVYIPRTMAAFVGSDITCSVLIGSHMAKKADTVLVVDIGTNGEMALIKEDKLVCCSTAAGPAFEGAEITMGSLAMDGAINKVYIEKGKIKYTAINGHKPVGICGSGLIDAVATFLKAGLIDASGLIDESAKDFSQYLTEYNGSPAIKIGDSSVLITQKDIRTFQLAKSAICAGIYSLADAMGVELSRIDKLLIAGGFGSFIDVKNAGETGLIPKELVGKATPIGNAAGMGASMILLSKYEQQKSFELAEKAEVLELSASGFFMDKYIECMMFD